MCDKPGYQYPEQVLFQIDDKEIGDYEETADLINRGGYDLVSIQHEYGIFGGDAGCYLLNLVRRLRMPVVTTLHTVLRDPDVHQRRVMDELLALSSRVVVMSQTAVGLLQEAHNIDPQKVELIQHGTPEMPVGAGRRLRSELGVKGPLILTFGLLSPDKGIQYVIQAMPQILEKHPDAIYVVAGTTHPQHLASQGNGYREGLHAMVKELGLESSVVFIDKFLPIEDLTDYLGAMDIYVTPSLNPNQITSGTLAFALASGKVVISTPYSYARELLADGRGVLVPFRDPGAIAKTVIELQDDPFAMADIRRRANEFGDLVRWPQIGKTYLKCFTETVEESLTRSCALVIPREEVQAPKVSWPKMDLSHVRTLTDDTGILQHATYGIPNRHEGYCVDDNARALILTLFLEKDHDLIDWQGRYLSFVHHAFNPETKRFRNFMSFSRNWLEESGSEDSHGRALWALGMCAARCGTSARQGLAKGLFRDAAPTVLDMTSPRTWAYALLGATEWLESDPLNAWLEDFTLDLSSRLWRHHLDNATDEWPWCEASLSYANARLPQALIEAGRLSGNQKMINSGLQGLTWLMSLQNQPNGIFVPIGCDGLRPDGKARSYFDQQPIEAWASISACLSAEKATGDPAWQAQAHRAFRWFLGENMLGIELYDRSTQGCCDGLHPDRRNENQGAESTLAFLCSSAELQAAAPKERKLISKGL